ncbi:MAG TPA: hypothetical protein VFX76_03765, partial [Roseiflexaceae bacterium]|nr:hypothetical protein [Roseiflexaceae bacterium]
MASTPEAQALTSYLEAHLDQYLAELRELCAIECPTSSKIGVDQAGAWVRRWVAARGWELRDWPDTLVGDGLVATVRGGAGPRIMLVAHLDTVYSIGIAAERPLQLNGDVLLGPGSADNKSGLLSGLYAMAALEDLGMLARCGTI